MGGKAASLVLGCLALTTVAHASGQRPRALMLGDKAPRIYASRWVNGKAERFEPGKTYVVAFWNSTSGPSIDQFGLLGEVKREHGSKLEVLAVNVSDPADDRLAQHAKAHPELVFAKDRPSRFSPLAIHGETCVSWMDAAGFVQVPAIFVVNGKGQIAWFGQAFRLREPLRQILAGNWDLKGRAAAYAERVRVEQDWSLASSRIDAAMREKNFKKAEQIADQVIQGARSVFGGPNSVRGRAVQAKLRAMAAQNHHKEALAFLTEMESHPQTAVGAALNKLGYAAFYMGDSKLAGKMVRGYTIGKYKNDSDVLNSLAWVVVDPRGGHPKPDLEAALLAAKRSVELRRSAYNVDTLARVYFVMGEVGKAAKLQREAIAMKPSPQEMPGYEARLAEYDSAAKSRAKA